MPKLKRGRGLSQCSVKISLKRARISGSQRSTLYRNLNINKLCERDRKREKELRNEKKEQTTSQVIAYGSFPWLMKAYRI